MLPDGTILANGDADRPIIFTWELPVGDWGPGDWGGLVLSGNAPVSGGQRVGEGNSGNYGGNDPADSSGSLRYVRVEFAGPERPRGAAERRLLRHQRLLPGRRQPDGSLDLRRLDHLLGQLSRHTNST